MSHCEIGIYGLGVMGQNLAINFARHGIKVAVFNRCVPGEETITEDFVAKRCRDESVMPTTSVAEFIAELNPPRKIMLMVQAGKAVDEVLAQLVPSLSTGDVVIDGGNSHFRDTARRQEALSANGIYLIGCGISGGAAGALKGSSLMPGGAEVGWEKAQKLLHVVAARDIAGRPCCSLLGSGGAGHFIKMVHNGIEYALMQLLAESYDLLARLLVLPDAEIALNFERVGVTLGCRAICFKSLAQILRTADTDGCSLLSKIRDQASSKGTGRDLAIAALELGFPATAICEAVNARALSSLGRERQTFAVYYSPPRLSRDPEALLARSPGSPLFCANAIAYAQGLGLLAHAATHYGWKISLPEVARVWSRGSIIQSALLDRIVSALAEAPAPDGVTFPHEVFEGELRNRLEHWRNSVAIAIESGIPTPVMTATLAYFDGLRSPRLPANLLQAQRDFFGEHGFERIDQPDRRLCHADWGKPPDDVV